VRVRQDIWDLGDEADPWRDPTILAYARAVGAMQALDESDPDHGANWSNQATIHARRSDRVPGRLEDQCQHGCWFFLPWHRMYLLQFEKILRSHMPDDVAGDWALPYWNYSDVAGRRVLPPAFREQQLPEGEGPNPLFTPRRQQAPLDINGGQPLPAAIVRLTAAMREEVFSRTTVGATAGFGGARTDPLFHHTARGPSGPLENSPHGAVHVAVGGLKVDPSSGQQVPDGLMSSFGTAALDPIFWLHHANLDRLWETWLRPAPGRGAHFNPTETDWLDMAYELVEPDGTRVTMHVRDVLDIEQQLGYTYSHLEPAGPPVPIEEAMVAMADEGRPPEMIGALDEPVTLAGRTSSASFPVSAPARPPAGGLEAAAPPRVYLNIENVEGTANPGLIYGVYVNLPEGEAPRPESPHFVGTLSFFGIETTQPRDDDEEAPHELRYVFDITPTVQALSAQGSWDSEQLRVSFSPLEVSDEEGPPTEVPAVKIGRVSLFVE
jgi:tyrosinase